MSKDQVSRGARGKTGDRRPGGKSASATGVRPQSGATQRGTPAHQQGGSRTEEPAGLGARRMAVRLIEAVLVSGHALDDALAIAERSRDGQALEARDRAFARLMAATVLRRLGSLDAVLLRFLERPLPATAVRARSILLIGSVQILLIGTPVHAAINLAVEQCRRDVRASRFDKLANAVLRRVAREGADALGALDHPKCDVPEWLWQRWGASYGEATARRIAVASLVEAPLDITAKADAAGWAERFGGTLLSTGSIRLAEAGRINELAGFVEGAWWVQDAAAALPARLLGPVAGLRVADLCAAPGGKTAELAAAGAHVTAVDQSRERLQRLGDNMARLGFSERVAPVAADVAGWRTDQPFDAVLLDAPCLSTGTVRRHPDLMHLKRPSDLGRIVALQGNLLAAAARLARPAGRLVYCVCSLEREEGEGVVDAFLAAHPGFRRDPVSPAEVGDNAAWTPPTGALRRLPSHEPLPGVEGMDGFFAARLVNSIT